MMCLALFFLVIFASLSPISKAEDPSSTRVGEEGIPTTPPTSSRSVEVEWRKKRLLQFLTHFRLDFSKFDSTCLKRRGDGVVAPHVPNASLTKYSRRRNRSRPRNRYAMALYTCHEGFTFPPQSADRMFCSRNKWVGPTPVCLEKGTVDECRDCDQTCSLHSDDKLRCSCWPGFEMRNSSCVDVDECATENGGCSGTCFNKPGSFQCFCPSGYQVGPNGKVCLDRNECLLRNGHGPCQDTCENTPGSYICSCANIQGTKLATDKHSCEDVNECEEEGNFGCSHLCLNTFGNAFCACRKGSILSTVDYKTCLSEEEEEPENLLVSPECPPGSDPDPDDPRICVEHEDCSVQNGGCEHTCVSSGSFRFCSCRPGFELLNETACIDLNECLIENGGCGQECQNLIGSFLCSCRDGFLIDGDKKGCKAMVCEEPMILGNSTGWECENQEVDASTRTPQLVVGTICALRCSHGFMVRNSGNDVDNSGLSSETIYCSSEGKWSPSEYINSSPCLSATCDELEEPRDGSLFPPTCRSSRVTLNTQCLLICAEGFYPKNGRIRTCSKGFKWFPEDQPECIPVPSTPRPYIHCPSDIEIDLKPGASSAYVKIPQPQANMDWYRYVEADPSWAKNLESDVPAGVTQVHFTARSPMTNDSASCHFKIHVVDREAPRVHGCPTSFEIRLGRGESSREVWWSEPKFSDNVKLHYVQQSHSPGHLLSRGTHHITFLAGDAEGNKARCSFTITLHGHDDLDDYSFYQSGAPYRHMVICPNLKTGRWTVHYAYFLPPGCRYHSQGLFSKLFKQNTLRHAIPRIRRRIF